MRNCKIKNLALVPACFNEDFLAWNKSKGLKIDLCPLSKSTKNINLSAEKFIKTDFQGSDHNILIINFKVNLSSICLICLGATSTKKLAIDEFTLVSSLETCLCSGFKGISAAHCVVHPSYCNTVKGLAGL